MKLFSKVIGEGAPLLILHGFLGLSDNWSTLGKRFAELGYEVHLLDQRNHGKSFWSNDFSYQLLSEDVKEYITEKNLGEVTIIGHSMGGKVAMFFAHYFPELLKKLIVVDIAPRLYPPHHQYIFDALNTLDFQLLKTRGEIDKKLAESIPEQGLRWFC